MKNPQVYHLSRVLSAGDQGRNFNYISLGGPQSPHVGKDSGQIRKEIQFHQYFDGTLSTFVRFPLIDLEKVTPMPVTPFPQSRLQELHRSS